MTYLNKDKGLDLDPVWDSGTTSLIPVNTNLFFFFYVTINCDVILVVHPSDWYRQNVFEICEVVLRFEPGEGNLIVERWVRGRTAQTERVLFRPLRFINGPFLLFENGLDVDRFSKMLNF